MQCSYCNSSKHRTKHCKKTNLPIMWSKVNSLYLNVIKLEIEKEDDKELVFMHYLAKYCISKYIECLCVKYVGAKEELEEYIYFKLIWNHLYLNSSNNLHPVPKIQTKENRNYYTNLITMTRNKEIDDQFKNYSIDPIIFVVKEKVIKKVFKEENVKKEKVIKEKVIEKEVIVKQQFAKEEKNVKIVGETFDCFLSILLCGILCNN